MVENVKVEMLATGFKFTEGPVWNTSEAFLLFSDIPANRIYKWSVNEGIKVFYETDGNPNGLSFDMQGRLLMCEHGKRRLGRFEKDGSYTVLAERFRGKRLNSPNDVVVRSDGYIYFTDPPYGIKPEQKELEFSGVYLFNPVSRELTLLLDDFLRPNGLAFSPDERFLYIADSERSHIKVFKINKKGFLGKERIFFEAEKPQHKRPDGIKVDIEGNLYVAAMNGVVILSKKGKALGMIKIPERPANLTIVYEDGKTLYVTARTSLYRMF